MKMNLIPTLAIVWLMQGLMVPGALAAGGHGHGSEEAHEDHEGRTRISERFAQEAGVITEAAAPRALRVTERLYGVIQPNQERLARIRAPYPGEIVELNASIGDQVNKGEVLARVKSRESLETYAIHAPISGVVTERHLNVGELAESVPLLELVDLSEVWLELLAYPEQKPRLKQGQRVDIRDMTGAQTGEARIDYIAPQRRRQDQGTLVRATLNNEKGIWSPGMMVTGDVVVEEREVPLAVKRSALQTFRDFTVVFARFGDTYEVRMLDLGEGDQDYVEVRDGLEPGTEYVIENSYLIKADVLKSGASHDH